jgi:hypothetical protein
MVNYGRKTRADKADDDKSVARGLAAVDRKAAALARQFEAERQCSTVWDGIGIEALF